VERLDEEVAAACAAWTIQAAASRGIGRSARLLAEILGDDLADPTRLRREQDHEEDAQQPSHQAQAYWSSAKTKRSAAARVNDSVGAACGSAHCSPCWRSMQ